MENRTVIITGASGGVGKALVKYFVEKEWNVEALPKSGMDITSPGHIQDVFNDIRYQYGKIDVLINNAAVFKSEFLSNCNQSDVDKIIDTNLKGTIQCTMAALSMMKKGGRIINISSVAGTYGIAKQSLYCASKHGINGFFDALQKENKDVLISTINPGGIDTPLWNENNPYQGDKSQLLKPEDIANLVGYITNLPGNVVFKEATLYPINEEH